MRLRQLVVALCLIAVPEVARAGGCPTGFHKPVALPKSGTGWLIPDTWATRGLSYGTSSMIGLIERAAKRVHKGSADATLYVGDISRREGGSSEWHKSHKCGRDADLLYFAIGPDGKQAPAPAHMVPYDADGTATVGGETWTFDTARNWALVKALIQDQVPIEKLFIADHLKRRLLVYARKHDSRALVHRADALMLQPGDAGPHDDHLHVRIAPSAADMKIVARGGATRHVHAHARPRRRHHKRHR